MKKSSKLEKMIVALILLILVAIILCFNMYVGWTDSNLEFVFNKEIPNWISGIVSILTTGLGFLFNIIVGLIRL